MLNANATIPPIPVTLEISRPLSIHVGMLHISRYGIFLMEDKNAGQAPEPALEGNSLQSLNGMRINSVSPALPSSKSSKLTWLHSLLVAIDRKSELPDTLFISYRHFTALKLVFAAGGERDAIQAFCEIQKWMNPTSLEDLYCFSPEAMAVLTNEQETPSSSTVSLSALPVNANNDSLPNETISLKPAATTETKWFAFDPAKDFERMGLGTDRNPNWRISTINQDYQFCPTYPALLAVPSRISDNTLRHIGKFRSKARIAALSYIHSNNITITRCAQPMAGIHLNRLIQDEKLVEAIFNSHVGCASSSQGLQPASLVHYIVDARPAANAYAQHAMGAGTETIANYPGAAHDFLNIENIHVVRDSFTKLFDACVSFDNTRISKSALERSSWLKHIRTILEGTQKIVSMVHSQRAHVLIHCSDGWDRTAQLSSLAQLCLDPYYRTIDGLMVLLEKEWISFGHKFKDRCGHLAKNSTANGIEGNSPNSSSQSGSGTGVSTGGSNTAGLFGSEREWKKAGKNVFGAASKLFNSLASNSNGGGMGGSGSGLASGETATPNNLAPKEVSPVFLQFLDCLYQLWTQYPTKFEFDERLLEFLYVSSYSCAFGNFLFNNQQECLAFRTRRPGSLTQKIDEASPSIWQYIFKRKSKFINPLYIPETTETATVLSPSTLSLVFWSRIYRISAQSSFPEEDVKLSLSSGNLLNSNTASNSTSSALPNNTIPSLQTQPSQNPYTNYLDPLVGSLSLAKDKKNSVGATSSQPPQRNFSPPPNQSIYMPEEEGILDMIDLQSPSFVQPETSSPARRLSSPNIAPAAIAMTVISKSSPPPPSKPKKVVEGVVDNPLMENNPWT